MKLGTNKQAAAAVVDLPNAALATRRRFLSSLARLPPQVLPPSAPQRFQAPLPRRAFADSTVTDTGTGTLHHSRFSRPPRTRSSSVPRSC